VQPLQLNLEKAPQLNCLAVWYGWRRVLRLVASYRVACVVYVHVLCGCVVVLLVCMCVCYTCACVLCAADQLAEVFWVEGLGPSKELWMAEADILDSTPPDVAVGATPAAAGVPDVHNRHSFADQVRNAQLWSCSVLGVIVLGRIMTGSKPLCRTFALVIRALAGSRVPHPSASWVARGSFQK
jgi:hypothetical protein